MSGPISGTSAQFDLAEKPQTKPIPQKPVEQPVPVGRDLPQDRGKPVPVPD